MRIEGFKDLRIEGIIGIAGEFLILMDLDVLGLQVESWIM